MNDFEFMYDDLVPINYKGDKQILISDLEQIFQNTKNILIDWQIRENSIRKIGQICIGDAKKSDIFLNFFNFEVISNLSIQLADLRSSVMKEACRIVSLCGKELGNLAEGGAVHLLSRLILFKIAGSANRVIADSSSKCILNLVKYINSIKIINNICEQKNIKSNFVRIICSQCILYIVTCYKKNLILNKVSILQETIKYLLTDPNADVRSIIRKAFITFRKRLPGEAENIYNLLEKNTQKQINEDENKYGNKIIINEENINKNNCDLFPIKSKKKALYSSGKKPYSHEIKFKLKESSDIRKLNYNNYNNQSEINYNYNNFLNENKNIINNDILEDKNQVEQNYMSKNQIYKSAKGNKIEGIFNKNNSNRIKINHKNLLKKLNEKFSNDINDNDNDNKSTNEIKKENILPPINQFYPSLNKSQNYKKISKSVLQKNKIYLNNINNENKNNLNIKNISNIKIINNENSNSLEKNIINFINKVNIQNNIDEKIKIFQYFFNVFNDILKESVNFSNSTLKQFVDIHIQNLNGNNISLIEQIVKNLLKIIFYMIHLLNYNDIQLVVKYIIKIINSGEKTVINLCYKLLDIIRTKGKIEDLINGIINSTENYNIQINDICYEYLAYLLNRYGATFENNSYFEQIFRLIINANINSKKIKKIINFLYNNNLENFKKLYREETNSNQAKIISIMENNNLNYIEELKGEIKINKIKNSKFLNKSIDNKLKKILIESKDFNNNINNYDLTEEVKLHLENGNVKLFLSCIEKNIKYIPSFIMILEKEKYSEHKYIKNYLNFIYSLINSKKFNNEMNQNMTILIDKIINLAIFNKNTTLIINSIQEILYILPIKINSELYFTEISKYLNEKCDIIVLKILLGSIKNYVIYDNNNNLEKNIPLFINGLIDLMEHSSNEIRKSAIYCCVEIYNIIKDKFNIYFEKIPKNTQKLINQLSKNNINNKNSY